MFEFEKDVIQLFELHNLNFDYNADGHNLTSDPVCIIFIPNCSDPGFLPPDVLPVKSKKTIRLWEDQYFQQKVIVNSRILSLTGKSSRIHGRKTKVKALRQPELDAFLKANHLNAPIIAKHRYGLYNKNELVAVGAFGRSCPIQDNGVTYKSHELIRYCSLLNTTVVGGLSKLISHFEKAEKPEHIMTYVDRAWSDGKTYEKLGFTIKANTPVQNIMLSPDKNERIFEKDLIRQMPGEDIEGQGWTRLKNLGNIKLVKFLK